MTRDEEVEAKIRAYTLAHARAVSFMEGLHDAKSGRGPTSAYERLRERYARGRISLGQFEAQVEVLLRSAA